MVGDEGGWDKDGCSYFRLEPTRVDCAGCGTPLLLRFEAHTGDQIKAAQVSESLAGVLCLGYCPLQ